MAVDVVAGRTFTLSSIPFFAMADLNLHLAALASLKGEILDLNHRLQHIAQERDILEKQLTKSQVQIKFEKLRMVRDHEDHLDQQAQRYEERLTELHSVIAELTKKIDGQRGNAIREEEECSHQSGESCSHGTSNYNNPNESCTDNEDLSGELQQPSSERDSRPEDQREFTAHKEVSTSPLPADCDSLEERATQVCKEMEALRYSPPDRTTTGHHHAVQMQEELMVLRSENVTLQEQLGRQEAELNKAKAALGSQQEERDRLRRKVRDLQSKLQAVLSQTSLCSQTGSPTHGKTAGNNSSASERVSSCEDTPVAKIAERVRLKKMESGDRQILGSEITSLGVSSSKVAEHLVHPLQEESRSQEIYQELYSSGSQIPASRIREFEVETERLSSRIEHLKSQNDLLSLTLEESKCQCDRLSVLIGKYESNNTALQLALRYSDQALEAYDVLTALMETETGLLLANCRAAGLGSVFKHVHDGIANENEEVAAILKRATDNRRSAEAIARHLLVRLDRNCDIMCGVMGCTASPWEDLSSHSCTTSTTTSTSSSCDTDFSKSEEQRLRDHIAQLKNDRSSVRTTVLELESVHIDPMVREPSSALDSQKLDLENAVLMQELTAMKEEKADLKAQVYLLERERASLELRLSSQDAQEQAYLAHIEHLKSEVKEQQEASEKMGEGCKRQLLQNGDSCEVTDDLGHELAEALKREKKLKFRLQELVSTIEKVNKNSELRHQQSAEFVNDLKRANSALVAAFEKSKKKYQTKIKKMEHQMLLMVDRHSAQMRLLKQRITMLEEADNCCRTIQPATSQTSL